MIFLWTILFYNPLYNALVFLVNIIPLHDIGIAVVILTVIVKIILYPLSRKAIISQFKLKALDPKIKEIKKQTTDKQEQAKKTFALYKEEGVNPFSGCLVLLIQIPIIFALYKVFLHGLTPEVTTNLYSFVHYPASLNTKFLNIFEITKPSIFFAVLAGISQYIQMHLQNSIKVEKPTDPKDMQQMLSYSMSTQMKYVLPIMIVFISWKLPLAVTLYWVVNNIVTIVQESRIKKSLKL